MSSRVTILDYGFGNLFSVASAIGHEGAEAEITGSPEKVARAERLVLPGVGAFGDGVKALAERGLIEPLRAYARTGRPMLGICLGMQFLLDGSEEFGAHEGLGLIPGRVVPIPPTGADGTAHSVPHIGWNALRRRNGEASWTGTALENTREGEAFYFVHSFMAAPADPSHVLAVADYDGAEIIAAIGRDNLFGVQFHPERSGPAGLRILKTFLSAPAHIENGPFSRCESETTTPIT